MQIIEESNSVMHDNYHADDETKNEDEWKNKAYGCLMGALIGDASGVLVKGAYKVSKHQADFAMGMQENEGPYYFAPGMVTSNGEMAISLLQALLEMEEGKFEPLILAKWYDFMNKSESPIKMHQGNQAALKIIADWEGKEIKDLLKIVKERINQFNAKNQSNGALIRAPVMAVFCSRVSKDEHINKAVRFEANFTHCH